MLRKRTKRSAAFKLKVALETLKERKTLNELASEYGVHPRVISRWKKELLDNGMSIFQTKKNLNQKKDIESKLLEKIGELTFELDWLKKKVGIDS